MYELWYSFEDYVKSIGFESENIISEVKSSLFQKVLDEILFLNDGSAAPLDYKYAEYKERTFRNHKYQLIFYARLIGEHYNIPVRLHFMWVSKEALRDLLHPMSYFFWASPFLHTYPEVKLNGKWVPMEATFDRELHEILLKKNLNFARYPERKDISIRFSKSGVTGAQQLTAVEGRDSFYADDLTPLKEMIESLPKFKKKLHPWALRRSSEWLNQKVRTP